MKCPAPTLILALFFLLLSASSRADPPARIFLMWDLPTDALTTNASVQVYCSTNASAPLKSWPMITNTPATTNAIQLSVSPGQAFYSVTYSNLWGVSDFSQVASTPILLRADQISLGVGLVKE